MNYNSFMKKNNQLLMEKNDYYIRIGLISLTFLWMSLIFFFSSQDADESNVMSDGITYYVAGILNFIIVHQMHLAQTDLTLNLSFIVRKIAHLTEYAILGMLVLKMLTLGNNSKKYHWFCTITFGFFYAMTDEYHQLFVSGRSGQLRDVIIDTVGCMIGIIIIECGSRKRKKTIREHFLPTGTKP